MQVKSDKDCNSQTIKIEITSGPHKGRTGTVIGSNGKALKNGRQYEVRFDAGDKAFFPGGEIKELNKIH